MRRHPRVIALSDLLDDDMAFAYLVALWSWACEFAPEGRIKAPNLCRLVERETSWRGETGKLYRTLVEERWLEPVSDTEAIVGGWDEYQRPHIEKAEKEAQRLRDYRAKQREEKQDTRTRTRTEGERTPYGGEYGNAYSTHDVREKRRGDENRGEEIKNHAPPKIPAVADDKEKSFTLAVETPKTKRGRPPKDPVEHAAERADADRWMARVREITGLDENVMCWSQGHFLAWKALRKKHGIETLMLALDGLENDKFYKRGNLGLFVSASAIQSGVAAAQQRRTNRGQDINEVWERIEREENAKREAANG